MKLASLTRGFALLAAVAVAGPASADRPSLIDLQATLDQVVSGLCDGDPATCGPAAMPAVGTLTFAPGTTNESVLPLVDLSLSIDNTIVCSPNCAYAGQGSFSPVSATVEQTSQAALLISLLASGALVAANVSVPTVGGGTLDLLFTGAALTSFAAADTPGRAQLGFAYQQISLQWQGGVSGWNLTTATGSGCTVPAGEVHVDLAGNAASGLNPGEIEATYTFGVAASGGSHPALAFGRRPPNPCYLRGTAARQIVSMTFDRLWSQDDAFANRQSVETVDVVNALIDRWELRLASGVVGEAIDLLLADGTLTTRAFDSGTGKQTGSEAWNF